MVVSHQPLRPHTFASSIAGSMTGTSHPQLSFLPHDPDLQLKASACRHPWRGCIGCQEQTCHPLVLHEQSASQSVVASIFHHSWWYSDLTSGLLWKCDAEPEQCNERTGILLSLALLGQAGVVWETVPAGAEPSQLSELQYQIQTWFQLYRKGF